ncbi:MAG: DUF4153 domain-containing protein [Saprospiraceae bacterium]
MRLPSLEQISQAVFGALMRFPFTLTAAIAATYALMWLIEDGGDPASRLWMTAQLGIPLLLACEISSKNPLIRWGLPVLGLGLLALYYTTLQVDDPGFEYRGLPRFLSLLTAAHLLVAAVPYLNTRSIADFWTYNKDLLANWLTGAAYALVLYLTLALAILAVNQLFNFDIDNKVYVHLFVLLAFLFVTLYFLHHFPSIWDDAPEERPYSRGFAVLCKYILIPVILLYFIIVSAYLIKIMLQGTLPQGYVGYLVLGFAFVGILTYLLNYRLPEVDTDALPRWFKQGFWWLLLPNVVLMMVSIGRKISDYGFTEPRYAVATSGVWLLGMCAYFILSRKDNIKVIPISLALICIFVVLSPFNAFNVSEKSQLKQLRGVLEPHGRWENGKMKPSDAPIMQKSAERVYSILQFFERRQRLHALEPFLPYPIEALPKTATAYNDVTRIEEWLNLGDAIKTDQQEIVFYITGTASESQSIAPIGVNIDGYIEYFLLNRDATEAPRPPSDGEKYMILSEDKQALEYRIYKKGASQLLESFDLGNLTTEWIKGQATDASNYMPINKEAVNYLEGQQFDLMLYLTDAEIKFEFNSEKPKLIYLNAGIFVRPKK